jgi:hypothetical protein
VVVMVGHLLVVLLLLHPWLDLLGLKMASTPLVLSFSLP